ncbi:hypothetical protein D9M70_593540 [compost metagenome]
MDTIRIDERCGLGGIQAHGIATRVAEPTASPSCVANVAPCSSHPGSLHRQPSSTKQKIVPMASPYGQAGTGHEFAAEVSFSGDVVMGNPKPSLVPRFRHADSQRDMR